MDQVNPNAASIARERLQRLRRTWAYAAAHSPFYRGRLPERAAEEVTLADLADVPVTQPADLANDFKRIRCRNEAPDFVVFTGGTSGLPRIVPGFLENLEHARPRIEDGPRPLGLTTGGGHHGTVPMPGGARGWLVVPLRNRKNYLWLVELLADRFDFPGYQTKVSRLVLPLPALKKLVHFVLENDVDLEKIELDWIATFAWFLSSRWRDHIQRVLGAPVIDNFGFTEIYHAIARRSAETGFYHYGPEVIWEVLDPDTLAPMKDGIGVLAVTSLLPEADGFVLFRYCPGDLVALGPSRDDGADRGFQPLGRVGHALRTGAGTALSWLLFASEVQEAIDFDPNVARLGDDRFSGITATDDDFFAKWRMQCVAADDGKPVAEVAIELKWSPSLFYDRWLELERNWRQRLLSTSRFLAAQVDAGQTRLRLLPLPPGSLKESDVFVC